MKPTLLIMKETRAQELRVAMVPQDLARLVEEGYKVFVEHNAGIGAGFSDQAYQNIGAKIRFINAETIEAYRAFFQDIHIIVRAKRPERKREILENQAITASTIMLGALDPLEKQAMHIHEYRQANIRAYSIDQIELPPDDPMNVLAAMSKIAGQLALLDAIKKFNGVVKKAVIIGYGTVGQAALAAALAQNLSVTVILTSVTEAEKIKLLGANVQLLNKADKLARQQAIIQNNLADASIVIASARKANQSAPLLVPLSTLQTMRKGAVIVDMALSEGGNVEGSEHDTTHILGNDVVVTNISGYPKAMPREASILWSAASLKFILHLQNRSNADNENFLTQANLV